MSAAVLVVHDLKNELGALEAGLERLARHPDVAAAEVAHRQCRQLRQRLVMYLTLYGGGELRAHCDDDAPAELLFSLAARHGPMLQIRPGDASTAFWYYDRCLVLMALEAAVHNALRYAASKVELGLREEEKNLVFSVTDDGPGLDSALPTAEHSTGLGTALCRAVAAAHGGSVRLFNRERGGACFELRLPT